MEVQTEREALGSDDAKLAQLRADAPDLAALIDDERLTVAEAFSAYEKRKSEAEALEANNRETILRLSEYAYRGAVAWSEFAADMDKLIADKDFRAEFIARLRVDPKELPHIQSGAKRLAETIASIIKKDGEPRHEPTARVQQVETAKIDGAERVLAVIESLQRRQPADGTERVLARVESAKKRKLAGEGQG